MSKDRRGLTLKISASMLRRLNSNERIPSPESLVRYAAVLDAFLYSGDVPEEGADTEYDLGSS